MFFSSSKNTVLSAIGGCSVEQGLFLRRVRCGSVPLYTTKPAQAQGSRLPAMRHRSLNNFCKKWDNKNFQDYDKQDLCGFSAETQEKNLTFTEFVLHYA